MGSAGERLQEWRERIARACERAGRDPAQVRLVGASKTVSATRLQPFIQAGLTDCGENYVQEAMTKIAELDVLAVSSVVRWHGIGALQRNKAREAVRLFDLIHSVDRIGLATELDKAARQAGKVQDVLLQVNVGDEASKAGCAPEALNELWHLCRPLTNLRVLGLMALPPYHEDPQAVRPYFRRLRELAGDVETWRRAVGETVPAVVELSMGMTNDFEVAIEEGATMVRIGTGLFGAR